MVIKSIKKMSSGRYQIIFDNNVKLTTYDEVILKNNLLYRKELTTKEINEINKSNGYYNVYSSITKFITKKMRSMKEVNEYLDKYDLSIMERDNLINSLKENGLLNDDRFIKAFISDRLYLSNDGPYKIKNDLLKHNLSEEDIDAEIANIDEKDVLDKLTKLVNKKIKSSKGSIYNIKQKIYYDMSNLGYSKDMIDSIFTLDIDDSKSLERDFNKAYMDIVKKEKDNNKIYLKLKQKLYQKGYSIDKIEKMINEKRY